MNASKTLHAALSAILVTSCTSHTIYVPVAPQVDTATFVETPLAKEGQLEITLNNCSVAHETMNHRQTEIIKYGERCLNSKGGYQRDKPDCKQVVDAILAVYQTNLHKIVSACIEKKYFLGVALTASDYIDRMNYSSSIVRRVRAGIESSK